MNKDEAIQVIRSNYPTDRKMLCEALEILIPELKESEDEKIRKEIIDLVEKQMPKSENKKWMLAWLEKQDPKKHEEELENAYKCADEVQYRKGYEDAKREFEKQSEQKPAWSEEDEKMRTCCEIAIDFFKNLGKNSSGHPHPNYFDLDEKIYPERVIDWLKSLKERMKGE